MLEHEYRCLVCAELVNIAWLVVVVKTLFIQSCIERGAGWEHRHTTVP